MPRLMDQKMETGSIGGTQAFRFSGLRIEHLGSSEYTVATVVVDETGSVSGFEKELEKMVLFAIEACKKDPRSLNLLLRVITFSSRYPSGVREIHGFMLLADVAGQNYEIRPGGETPLCDACFSAIGATNEYGNKLADNDFGCNGIIFIITDGGENASTATMAMVQKEIKKAVSGERLESLVTVLIGINTKHCSQELADFKNRAGLTQYIDAGDATPDKLAKIGGFISQSVSSQSQAIGTGGPSQNIAATI